MLEFEKKIGPSNSKNFLKLYHNRLTCYLRRDIYEFIIARGDEKEGENEFFDLTTFISKIKDKEEADIIINSIITELSVIGWNCKLCFGNTGLYIYSDTIPIGCSAWEEI